MNDEGGHALRLLSDGTPTAPDSATACAALGVRGVRKVFGGVTALDSIDVTVGAGEAVAVIGPNGAGKSTLLKLVAGIHRADAGEIWLGDARLDRLPEHSIVRSGVALAHQVPRPFGQLSVRENVLVGALARAKGARARARVDEVLEACALADKAALLAGSLNVLDLKRLEVARALATCPALLMLDEVAAGLTGRELEAAIQLIRSLHASGLTIVLVEHVERVVRELVERVIVLDWGRQIAEGTPDEVARHPEVRAVYLGNERRPVSPAKRNRATGKPILRIERVSAGYGSILALRDVELEVRPGEVIGVLGANGAGKSTLAGAISGAVPARSGRIEALGEDVTKRPAHERARLGIVLCPEGRRVFADLTVAQNLVLGAPLRLSRRELEPRLQRVQEMFPVLAERARHPAGALSGGQQQMLAIGRALMAEPRLLVCDEISLGLAPVAVDALYAALAAINERGVSILLIEQNVHRCLETADRVYVLSRGRVAYAGDPVALLDEALLDEAYFGHDVNRAAAARPAHIT